MAKKAKAKSAAKAKPAAKSKPAAKAKSTPKSTPKSVAKKPAAKAAPAPAAAPPLPDARHSLTACLVVRGAAQAMDFYKHAFGAVERMRMPGPDGFSIMHAEVKIGDSILFVVDENPATGCLAPPSVNTSTSSMHLNVPDVDKVFQQAIDAGATVVMPVSDMFWGDRFGQVKDPFGHRWGIATHQETLTLAEIGARAEKFFATMPKPPAATEATA